MPALSATPNESSAIMDLAVPLAATDSTAPASVCLKSKPAGPLRSTTILVMGSGVARNWATRTWVTWSELIANRWRRS